MTISKYHEISGGEGGKGERQQEIWEEITYIFLGLLDTSCDLVVGCKSIVITAVDLIFSVHPKGSFGAELLDSHLPGRHGGLGPGEPPKVGGKSAKKFDQVMHVGQRLRILEKNR